MEKTLQKTISPFCSDTKIIKRLLTARPMYTLEKVVAYFRGWARARNWDELTLFQVALPLWARRHGKKAQAAVAKFLQEEESKAGGE